MSKALVIRHHLEDNAGLIGEALLARDVVFDTYMLDASSPTPALEGYDYLVILGSKHAVYDEAVEAAWFGRELQLIEQADEAGVPILGICFGAQALCRAFGGTVAPSLEPEVGWYRIEAAEEQEFPEGPWFEYHFDVCSLPPQAEVWALSPRAVQAFAIGNHVGVQFHPEIDDVQLAQWLAVGDEEVRSLGIDTDELLALTRDETPLARERALVLVDKFLDRLAPVRR
jgi:GMP synthase-like glutamine amidotransferase